jgi:hypothetical protein
MGVFQKFAKTNENEGKPFKILQNRSKTNIFVIDYEEEEKRKKLSFVFLWNKAKKNEDNRFSAIEDLPLRQTGPVAQNSCILYFISVTHSKLSIVQWASQLLALSCGQSWTLANLSTAH